VNELTIGLILVPVIALGAIASLWSAIWRLVENFRLVVGHIR